LVSFTDISNLVEKEIKLKESNATKDKLFSILTHDLKNPFNALLGFTELLMQNYDRYDAGKHKKYIELLNRSAKSAHMLLENLLIWSRSQRDVISFDPALTPVKPIIDLIISQHESTLLSKSISVTQKITPPALSVYADVEMLKTILRNLLSNAIKFSEEEGEVEILCSETKETTLFMVKDYGKGIKKEDQKKLFRLDTKFTTPGTKQEKGTGLGLILCKDFVERNGGEIWVESKPGKGSTFRFSVPKQK
jgi:signal transduction histidine kinase